MSMIPLVGAVLLERAATGKAARLRDPLLAAAAAAGPR